MPELLRAATGTAKTPRFVEIRRAGRGGSVLEPQGGGNNQEPGT